MLIMFYKEIAETRNKMAGVVIEFSVLPKCYVTGKLIPEKFSSSLKG